jgi:hypothetical protein
MAQHRVLSAIPTDPLVELEEGSKRMFARSLSNLRLLRHVPHLSDNLSQIAMCVGVL